MTTALGIKESREPYQDDRTDLVRPSKDLESPLYLFAEASTIVVEGPVDERQEVGGKVGVDRERRVGKTLVLVAEIKCLSWNAVCASKIPAISRNGETRHLEKGIFAWRSVATEDGIVEGAVNFPVAGGIWRNVCGGMVAFPVVLIRVTDGILRDAHVRMPLPDSLKYQVVVGRYDVAAKAVKYEAIDAAMGKGGKSVR